MNNNKLLTPEDVEQIEVDQYEDSARYIKLFHGQFRQMGYALANRKKKAPIRVLEAVMFTPLEDVELLGKEERELFDICQKIMYHKNKITEFAIKRRMEAEKKGDNNNE